MSDTGLQFRIVPGLPGTGPLPEQFSATGYGKHREGLVVEFTSVDGKSWVGNFQRGLTSFSDVLPHPNGRSLIVIAGGTAFVVDPNTRQLLKTFGAQIEIVLVDQKRHQVVFGNGLWFEAISAAELRWRSRRISWDGMRNV